MNVDNKDNFQWEVPREGVHLRKTATTTHPPTPEQESEKITEDDSTSLPQLLLLGLFSNVYLLYTLSDLPCTLIPNLCRCFIAVNAFRCVFPNRYNGNIVLHDSALSSIFLTRCLATCSEVSWLYLMGHIISQYSPSPLISMLGGWSLPLLCCLAQCFVWSSLLLQTDALMLLEEGTWAVMFILNTAFNITLYLAGVTSPLVITSLVFGALYLPWQLLFHLPYILSLEDSPLTRAQVNVCNVIVGFKRAVCYWKQSKSLKDWGGMVGIVWMFGYWWVESAWIATIGWVLAAEDRI